MCVVRMVIKVKRKAERSQGMVGVCIDYAKVTALDWRGVKVGKPVL